MSCTVKEVAGWLGEVFPPSVAEPWDNVGLLVGDPEGPVQRILVALDPSPGALTEAIESKAELLVTHHPLWLEPISSVLRPHPVGGLIWRAVRGGVSIYCAHTNLDKAVGGPNDLLARRLGLEEVEELEGGLGRVGSLPEALTWCDFSMWIRSRMDAVGIRVAGCPVESVRRVALCCGSGASLLERAHARGAQVLVTGDVKYHDARKAETMGMTLMDVGHFASEGFLPPWLAERIREEGRKRHWGVEVLVYQGDREPFRTVGPGLENMDSSGGANCRSK